MPGVPAVPEAPYGVLLMAYGAPLAPEDVEPYLLDVRGGRPTPSAIIEELKRRYLAIGGRSPLLERTQEQAAALRERLGGPPVFVGMRHWHPYIRDVLAEACRAGIRRLVALPMAPHYSRLSVGAYQRAVEEARGEIEVAFIEQWFDHPKFLEAVAARIRQALDRFPPSRRPAVPIVFTAHSLPARILEDGDPYPRQLEASMAGVMALLPPQPHRLAYQSAGQSAEPWLGPDAEATLQELRAQGNDAVLVCPIGFVADHLEVLYDVDIALRERARQLGITLVRTESLNADPLLIEALADLTIGRAQSRGWTS